MVLVAFTIALRFLVLLECFHDLVLIKSAVLVFFKLYGYGIHAFITELSLRIEVPLWKFSKVSNKSISQASCVFTDE